MSYMTQEQIDDAVILGADHVGEKNRKLFGFPIVEASEPIADFGVGDIVLAPLSDYRELVILDALNSEDTDDNTEE